MELSALAGNGPLKRQLDQETARRGLSHAYIISGPAGSGRRTLAGILAQALVCAGQGPALPCGACPGCRKAAAGIHPDIIRAGADGKDINVAQVRALRADAYIRPNEAGRKVYLLENAQAMNASAQNAMLKLLEEGPAYAAFLLLTDNADALLETVRSRCERLCLSPVTRAQALSWLRGRFPDRPEDALREAAERCEGLLGRAVAGLEEGGEGDAAVSSAALTLADRLARRDELGLMELCVTLEKWDRERLGALLDECVLLLRDALVCAAGAPVENGPGRREAARAAAAALDQAALAGAVDKLALLRAACAGNVGAGHLAGWLCAALAE